MQVQDDSQIQPPLTRPNVADIACPFLVWLVGNEVPIQQGRRIVELVVAVRRHLVFAGSDIGYAVCRVSLSTRRCPISRPISFSSSVIRGLPLSLNASIQLPCSA